VIRIRHLALASVCAMLAATGAAGSAGESGPKNTIRWEDTGPAPGVYFYWYEPSFYTGFAPRTQEPGRVYLQLGRGNQVRLTLVLGDEQIDSYVEDLLMRQQTKQRLVDEKVIELTTNTQFEPFVQRLAELGAGKLAASRATLDAETYRAKSLELMKTLNPGRIFHIRMGVDGLLGQWKDHLLRTPDAELASRNGQLEAINAILPGRVKRYQLDPELAAALPRMVELARASDKDPGAATVEYRREGLLFLEKATRGLYPVRDAHVDVHEFTAIYPAGTAQSFVTYQGKKLPNFGVTGVWPLIKRTQGRGAVGMVDYLSSNPAYGFITMLPYEDAGGIVYNAFHNAGVRTTMSTAFLPQSWRRVEGTRKKDAYQNLWIASRGPVSNGCTRLPSGHMAELRHVLPSDSDRLEGIPTYRNLPHTYDVYDIDGDGTPEVIGLKYFLAYACTNQRVPYKAWAPNRREPFYEWLYHGELSYREDATAFFPEAMACNFVGRRAEPGRKYENIALYEAEFEPETIQFYRLRSAAFDSAKGFEFNRELRRLAVGYSASLQKLFLSK
jgi:hypothetical protein